MSEKKKKPLKEAFDSTSLKQILNELLKNRKVVEKKRITDPDGVTYEKVVHKTKDVEYAICATHVPIDHIFKYANNKCNQCNSKGYYVLHIEKRRLPDPGDHTLLSSEPVDAMTDEQLKLWREREVKKKTWRVLLPCQCALKKSLRKEGDLYANDLGNILVRVDYEECTGKK